ncbi:MAG: amino acid permease [Gemmatimonadota bacterium]|nr:MAG: amino acid permease [Gemmatimonadota bacterium]
MKLRRKLNFLHVFSICSGAMFSGLFILPGLAYAQAGPALLFSYFLASLLALTGMLSQAELASAMPRAGGTYFYVTRSMGPGVGSVYGQITWFSLALKSAYEFFFIATIVAIISNLNPHLVAALLCLSFLVVNIIGIKEAGNLQTVLVMSLLAALLFYIFRGLPKVDLRNMQPFIPYGWSSIFSTAGFIFISYGGLLKVASMGEEVREPGRVLPWGMILSFIVVTLCYLTIVFVTIGTLGGAKLDGSLNPISDGARVFLGSGGSILFGIAGILAVASAANTGIMSGSRYPLALARDDMLPNFFGRINQRFGTPYISILITGTVVIAAMFLPLHVLVKAASSVLILTYIFTGLAVVILREGRLQNYRPPFRAPLYPWIQIVGTIGFLILLYEIGREALLSSIILIVGGFLVYWFYGRIRSYREYALLHLIERITAKDLTQHSLEAELKEIIRERDDMLMDRFDHLIEESHILDIDHTVDADEFFRMASRIIAERLKADPETLFKLFVEREGESSTVINPYLAIPHIIVEGEKTFDILLVRCREGISFSDEAPGVHAVFLLVGSRDERPFHLRALAAIAQIVQDSSFDKRWMAARSEEVLRDIILLGARMRH